jgi:hypothetical protein
MTRMRANHARSDNSGHSPFWSGSLSPPLQNKECHFCNQKEREFTSFERAYIPNVTKMLNRKLLQRGCAYKSTLVGGNKARPDLIERIKFQLPSHLMKRWRISQKRCRQVFRTRFHVCTCGTIFGFHFRLFIHYFSYKGDLGPLLV